MFTALPLSYFGADTVHSIHPGATVTISPPEALHDHYPDLPDTFLHVDVHRQELTLYVRHTPVRTYPVSTAAAGLGNEADSMKTPAGLHEIVEKIGDDAQPGAVFSSRQDTGRVWDGRDTTEDLVLTRILRLAGLQDGVNRGPGIDSYERYIYIHGTSNEAAIGTPASHGCIRMRNRDIIDLFSRVQEGTRVVIGE